MADVRALPRRVLHELYTFGNRDQLFGNLLHWLLDKDGEHGLGTAMAHALGSFLDDNDHPELGMALQSDMLPISTEVIVRGATADVLVMLADSPRLSLVSVYTLVYEPHVITEYQAMDASPIAISHPGDPAEGDVSLPLWNWIEELRTHLPRISAGPFGDFTRQLLAYDPSDPEATSSIEDLYGDQLAPPPELAAPPPPAPTPAPAPPPRPAAPRKPAAPSCGGGGGWGEDTGGGLSDGWMGDGDDRGGGGGGGLSDGWMGG